MFFCEILRLNRKVCASKTSILMTFTDLTVFWFQRNFFHLRCSVFRGLTCSVDDQLWSSSDTGGFDLLSRRLAGLKNLFWTHSTNMCQLLLRETEPDVPVCLLSFSIVAQKYFILWCCRRAEPVMEEVMHVCFNHTFKMLR